MDYIILAVAALTISAVLVPVTHYVDKWDRKRVGLDQDAEQYK